MREPVTWGTHTGLSSGGGWSVIVAAAPHPIIENATMTTKFTSEEIDNILDNLIPQIADPNDYDFFRALLRLKAEESSTTQFAIFVKKLLDSRK